MASDSVRDAPAVRLDAAELADLLCLRDTAAGAISRRALGIAVEPGRSGRESLAARGLWRERNGMGLPSGPAITVGDTLTAAVGWLRIGTSEVPVATIVIGPEHTLLLAALGDGAQEIATLRVDADVAEVTAGICRHLAHATDAQVQVHLVGLDATATPRERVVTVLDGAFEDDGAGKEGAAGDGDAAGDDAGLTRSLRAAIRAVMPR